MKKKCSKPTILWHLLYTITLSNDKIAEMMMAKTLIPTTDLKKSNYIQRKPDVSSTVSIMVLKKSVYSNEWCCQTYNGDSH